MSVKPLKDESGVLGKAYKLLPSELHDSFLKALAELEDNDAHKNNVFPHTKLHKVRGNIKGVAVYRADIDKISGWRLHVQYDDDHFLLLNDILTGQEHDKVIDVIKLRKHRYKK